MDYFTKWPEAFAIPDQEATTVAHVLTEGMFCRFGVPLELHSDQGKNFESAVFREVCRILGITKTRTTPGYPQSDGMVERMNRTLLNGLSMYVSEHQRDWDEYVQLFLMAYRTAEHESTGYSPDQLMMGRRITLPVRLLLGQPREEGPDDLPSFVQRLDEVLGYVHAHARQNLRHSQSRMKKTYDSRAAKDLFSPGDTVWLYEPKRRKGISPKLQREWCGPYKVLDCLTDVVYRIQKSAHTKPQVVNRYRLWRYVGDLEDPWFLDTSQPDVPCDTASDPTTETAVEDIELASDEVLEDIPIPTVPPTSNSAPLVDPAVSPGQRTRQGRRVRPPARYLNY
jgi:hypothetical protein